MSNPLLMLDVKDQGENANIPAPNLCVVLLTYLRTGMAVRTVKSFCENIDYPKELISFYIADDGSPWEHMQAIIDEIQAHEVAVYGYHNEKITPGPIVGKGWNRGLQKGHQASDFVFLLEDDWVLTKELDIRPYVRCLLQRADVGIIRLSGLPVGGELRVQGFNGIHYLEYLRSAPMAYSGNPHIRHVRFSAYYGFFATDRNPGDIEINYDERFRQYPDGPNIWRPADLPAWGIFGHIGNERTW